MFVAVRRCRSSSVVLPVLVASALGAAGCWSSYAEWSDGETPEVVVPEDGGVAEDVPGPDDAGVPDEGGVDDGGLDDGGLDDGGADDAGVDADDVPDDASSPCPEGWYDPTSGLCWQDPPADTYMNWYDAVSHCENLVLGGHPVGTWRLPTISDLRSLIRGCPGTETGGDCGVTDACLGDGCGTWGPCGGCSWLEGPGVGSAYWPAGVAGEVSGYWSSSSYSGFSFWAWYVLFLDGRVNYSAKSNNAYVRCIRDGP